MKHFTWALYATYFLCGHVLIVFGSVMPQIIKHYHLSYTESGMLVFNGTAGFLLGVVIAAYLIKRIGYKKILSSISIFVAAVQFEMLLTPPFGLVYFLNFLSGVAMAVLQIVVATIIMETYVGRRAVMMSRTEVAFGLGALCMPVISSILITFDTWRHSFLVTSILAVFVAVIWQMISVPANHMDQDSAKPLDAANPPPRTMNRKMKKILLSLFLFMIFIYDGIETSLNNFLPSIFITHVRVVPSYASLSVSVFWIAMVIGRALTGWIVKKVTYHRFLLWSITGTICLLACFAIWRNVIFCYILLFFLGLTMSGIYSITMVFANHTFPGLIRFVTSLVTGFAGFGSALFPAILGYAMDHTNTLVSLWIITGYSCLFLFALLVLLLLLFIKRKVRFLVTSNTEKG
ncbi:MFS transporter [Scopulibacillus cellulosilyticus]|uniref:MFS transporter n=1 Tax=Scopulibacillus cellulosilyticus TaxID=2665665 RepID=A0ABW2Q3P5_9BACL